MIWACGEKTCRDFVVIRVNQVERSQMTRGRRRPRKIIRKVIRKYLETNNLDKSIVVMNRTL